MEIAALDDSRRKSCEMSLLWWLRSPILSPATNLKLSRVRRDLKSGLNVYELGTRSNVD